MYTAQQTAANPRRPGSPGAPELLVGMDQIGKVYPNGTIAVQQVNLQAGRVSSSVLSDRRDAENRPCLT